MNIFALDHDPTLAAQAHCDAHVVKMPTETAQMLSTAVAVVHAPQSHLYKPSHGNHPCTRWARATRANFEWLVALGLALVDEHARRFPNTLAGKRGHAARKIIEQACVFADKLPSGSLTPFALAMPDVFKGEDRVLAYRSFYRAEKARFARWSAPAAPPQWWQIENER